MRIVIWNDLTMKKCDLLKFIVALNMKNGDSAREPMLKKHPCGLMDATHKILHLGMVYYCFTNLRKVAA